MFVCTAIRSTNSMLDGFGNIESHVDRAKSLKMKAFGISDHGTISGCPEHWAVCKKNGIKPILGVELYIALDPVEAKTRDNTHMVIWAKNHQGWQDLMKLTSHTNALGIFYYKPRIYPWNTEKALGLEHFCTGNIQGFSGHQGSILSDNLFYDVFSETETPESRKLKIRQAYSNKKSVKDSEHYRQFLKPNWLDSGCEMALRLEKIFGKGNFFIELQNEFDPADRIPCSIHPLIVECLREISKECGIPCMASSDPHYARKEDADDQRMMVSINMKETEANVQAKLDSHEDVDIMPFFGSNSFYIHSYEEMAAKFTQEELDLTVKVADAIEEYDISHKPILPTYDVPEYDASGLPSDITNMKTPSDKYLLYLAVEGAKKMKPWVKSEKPKTEYWERLKRELSVVFKAGLSDYFLIVWDMCVAADNRPKDHSFDWQKNLKANGAIDAIPRGVGRGSAAGCLLSYVIGITGVDPLEYDLLFERFYNEGRNTATRVALPDIDTDFSIVNREWVIDYLRWKYGEKNVGKIVTFGTIKGKAAIKDIMRVKGVTGGFEFANQITKFIPDESVIAEELQEMAEAGEADYGLLRYAIDNVPEFQEVYSMPEVRPMIDQAVRIENTIKSKGKHPAGTVIVPHDIDDHFPLILDTHGKELIIGVDMHMCEMMGGVKIDILGTCVLDKLALGAKLVNTKAVESK